RGLGDDADGARAPAHALARDQPRLVRLVRAYARRAGVRRSDLGSGGAWNDHRPGGLHLYRDRCGRAALAPDQRDRLMPVYWKPKYGTRSSRHKAWVRQQQKREAANEGRPKVSV